MFFRCSQATHRNFLPWGAGNSPALHASRASSLCNGAFIDVIFQLFKTWWLQNCQRKVSKTHNTWFYRLFLFFVDIVVSSILNIHPEAWGFMIQSNEKIVQMGWFNQQPVVFVLMWDSWKISRLHHGVSCGWNPIWFVCCNFNFKFQNLNLFWYS